MAKRPREAPSALDRLNFALITLGVIVAAVMVANVLMLWFAPP